MCSSPISPNITLPNREFLLPIREMEASLTTKSKAIKTEKGNRK
jgi:hypothetical protein